MIRKPSDTQAIGFHVEGKRLTCAHMVLAAGTPKLKRLEVIDLKNTEEGALTYQKESDQALVVEFSDQYLTVADLFSGDLMTRRLRIRLQKEKEIEAAFPFEAESALSYPVNQAILDKIPLEKDSEGVSFTLIAAKKKSVEESLQTLASLKIDPEIITPTPSALAAFSDHYTETKKKLLILQVGDTAISTSIVVEGKLLSSHRASIGISILENGYAQDRARDPELLEFSFQALDFQGEDLALAPLLQQAIVKLRKEIEWLVVSELRTIDEANEEKPELLITGEVLGLSGIHSLLFSGIDLVEIPLVCKEGLEENFLEARKSAIAIGCALSGLQKYSYPINLRQEEFSFAQPWRRFKKSIALFAGLSLLLALMVFIFGEALIGFREDELRSQFAETIAESDLAFVVFERKYQNLKEGDSVKLPSFKELSLQDLQSRISYLDKMISGKPDYFALQPGVPLVSDFLAWLTTLPMLQKENPAIQIESLTYTLVKRPEMNKKGERYQVKIDLEISASAPKSAREFHNLLIEPNEMIDPKGEVKWGQSKSNWRTSFFLKDKTTYPRAG